MPRLSPSVVLLATTFACAPELELPTKAQLNCTSDADCPAGQSCITASAQCAASDAPCVAIRNGRLEATDDGASCERDGKTGACLGGLCIFPSCGNVILEGDEVCDDGNDVDTDGCRNNCTLARCGDGVIFANVEECDHGTLNGQDGDSCTSACRNNTCGDGHIGPNEDCDNGGSNGSTGNVCTSQCKHNVCGDRHIGEMEQCDNGDDNGAVGDVCTDACMLNVCGDNHIGPGEDCDDGDTIAADGCSDGCQDEPYCFTWPAGACPTGLDKWCTQVPPNCESSTLAEEVCKLCAGADCTTTDACSGSVTGWSTQGTCPIVFVYTSGICGPGSINDPLNCNANIGGGEHWCN